MARPLRLQFPGGLYHITARGDDRQSIFADDADCSAFVIVLASVVARHRVRCHAYCLMGNHYHLLLETPDGNLSRAMRTGLGQDQDALARFESGPTLGDAAFVRRLDALGHPATQCTEFPRSPTSSPARPPGAERDARAVTAVRDHGDPMKEVADFIGRHYITVSRALAQADGLPPRRKNVGM
jgi:REP element-mobilizing transposase RayT